MVTPSIPGAPLFFLTFSYAFHRFPSEITLSINLIPSCSSISRRHPYALLCTLSFPTYLSIGSHLSGKYHDDYLWRDKRSEEHTSELQSRGHLVCRLLLEK